LSDGILKYISQCIGHGCLPKQFNKEEEEELQDAHVKVAHICLVCYNVGDSGYDCEQYFVVKV
jgi:hypothetical protein